MTTDNTSSSTLFHVQNLELRIASRLLLSGLSMQIRKGERVGIAGPSGIGKTTLIRGLISGRWPEGSTCVAQTKLKDTVFYGAQMHNLPDEVNVGDLLHHLCPVIEERNRVLEAVSLSSRRSSRIGKLSGGEYQRLTVAVAICSHAPVIVIDEPVTAVDADLKRRSIKLLSASMVERGTTGAFVSHDPFTLALLCDRIHLLGDRPSVIEFHSPHPRTITDITDGMDRGSLDALTKSMLAD